MIFASGIICSVAGTGERGYTGDGGAATAATLSEPFMCVLDAHGNLYEAEAMNHCIRRIDAVTGVITTIAGTGEPGYRGDGGPGTLAQLHEPNDCFLDGRGRLLIADVQDQRIRRLDLATGIITTFAGTGERGYSGDGGPALAATWGAPKALRCDAQGNVLVVDTENHAIRRIEAASGVVTTVAGGQLGGDGDNGPATAAGLDRPHGCCVDAQGNLYIADSNNHRVRVVGA